MSEDSGSFAPPGSAAEVEEGRTLSPKFDAGGLVTCVATDARTGDVLMVAHMNAAALARTIETGEAWYFSRSRQALWRKGETSGHVQRVTWNAVRKEFGIGAHQKWVWLQRAVRPFSVFAVPESFLVPFHLLTNVPAIGAAARYTCLKWQKLRTRRFI